MRLLLFVLLVCTFSHCLGQGIWAFKKQTDTPAVRKPVLNYLTPFTRLPDSGVTYSVTLLVEKALHPLAGHAFLRLSKSNGKDSVVQYIGFYRLNPYQALLSDQPVAAKLEDDAFHAYHAFWRKPITPSQLQTALGEIQRLAASHRYQTFHFNSVNFALEVMNRIDPTHPLSIPHRLATSLRLYHLLKTLTGQSHDAAEIICSSRHVQYAGANHQPDAPEPFIHRF